MLGTKKPEQKHEHKGDHKGEHKGDHKGEHKDDHKGDHKGEHKAAPTRGAKGHTPMPDGCHAWGCKAHSKRFNFCDDHYDHFKFGLIKKTGEPVSDYEKKFEHYQAYKAKRNSQKVA